MDQSQRLLAFIDLDALADNMKAIRKKVPDNVSVMAVVKADAYGHGAFECAEVALENGATWLCVAILEEGIQLRRLGITAPILTLGYVPPLAMADAVDYDIIPTIYSFEAAKNLSDVACKKGKKAKIHIKIDSGMGRLGFQPTESDMDVIAEIAKLPGVEINGMFTHFAVSDEDVKYTEFQKNNYVFAVEALKKRGIEIPFKHVANSAAIVDFEDLYFDMVRAGGVLYGYYPDEPSDKFPSRQIMSLKANISHIKTLPEGKYIGYGCTYKTEGKRIIATLPVGYADGYRRDFSNAGKVLVNGSFAPVVGRVCMDQMMIDVTDIPNVKVGDEAVLLGRSGDNEITLADMAGLLKTIKAEITCAVAKRVPRAYIRNGEIEKITTYI